MGLVEEMKKLETLGGPLSEGSTIRTEEVPKLVHILELKEDKAVPMIDAYLLPGTKVSDIKSRLGISLRDCLVSVKDRRVLCNTTDIYTLTEPGQKYIIVPDSSCASISDEIRQKERGIYPVPSEGNFRLVHTLGILSRSMSAGRAGKNKGEW